VIEPTLPLPPATPSTVQVTAPPPGTVGVNCCVCHKVMAAALGATLTVPLAMVTVAVLTLLVPPLPVQVSEYDVVAASAPVPRVPPVASVPLQPPEAAQDVALLELQVSVEEPPLGTTVGYALNVASGITPTTTVAVPLVPPGPLQASE
jgi:hypothetical protein